MLASPALPHSAAAHIPTVVPITLHELQSRITAAFRGLCGVPHEVIAAAPGRVNLIGDHTDYNGGVVLPMAIDAWCVCAAGARRGVPGSRITALDTGQTRTLSFIPREAMQVGLASGSPLLGGDWLGYVAGVLGLLAPESEPPPLELVIGGSIPPGGGLASSAALEVSVSLAVIESWGLAHPPMLDLADLCRRAEHRFAGVPCGIMDQAICLLARERTALLLNCGDLESRHVPIPESARVVVADTGVRHSLAAGQYATRRAECERACRAIGVRSLSELDPRDLPTGPPESVSIEIRRARHVATENTRVRAVARMLENASPDLAGIGRLLDASHESLRLDFEVSCPELDRAAAGMRRMSGALGARMTGGGFGGCAIALVHADAAERVAAQTVHLGLARSSRVVRPVSGAALVAPQNDGLRRSEEA